MRFRHVEFIDYFTIEEIVNSNVHLLRAQSLGFLFRLQLRSSQSLNPMLLIRSKPRLLAISQHAASQEIHHLANDDQDECNRIKEVDYVSKHLDSNDRAPEVGGEERNVEKRGRGHAQQDRHDAVEREKDEGVADNPACYCGIPS